MDQRDIDAAMMWWANEISEERRRELAARGIDLQNPDVLTAEEAMVPVGLARVAVVQSAADWVTMSDARKRALLNPESMENLVRTAIRDRFLAWVAGPIDEWWKPEPELMDPS